MGQTANYGLKQWETWERPRRTDLNQVVDSIDTALAGKAEIVTGRYVGDGESNQTVHLGFRPKAVLIEHSDGRRSEGNNYRFWGGLMTDGGEIVLATVTDTGFSVHLWGQGAYTNAQGIDYHYITFR